MPVYVFFGSINFICLSSFVFVVDSGSMDVPNPPRKRFTPDPVPVVSLEFLVVQTYVFILVSLFTRFGHLNLHTKQNLEQ